MTKKPNGYWRKYENALVLAKECSSVVEFNKKYHTAYVMAGKYGYLERVKKDAGFKSLSCVDYRGKQIASWHIKSFSGYKTKSDGRRERLYNCICVKCGSKKKMSVQRFKVIEREGYECWQCSRKSRVLPDGLAIKKSAYYSHKNAAKKRNIRTYLSFEDYIKIASKSCVYCSSMSERKNYKTDQMYPLNSVDRKNNEHYYKISNSQPVCFKCQSMKSNMKHKDFLTHVTKIARSLGSL